MLPIAVARAHGWGRGDQKGTKVAIYKKGADPDALDRSAPRVDGRFVPRPSGRWAAAWSMNRPGNWVANPYQAGSWARWRTAARWA